MFTALSTAAAAPTPRRLTAAETGLTVSGSVEIAADGPVDRNDLTAAAAAAAVEVGALL